MVCEPEKLRSFVDSAEDEQIEDRDVYDAGEYDELAEIVKAWSKPCFRLGLAHARLGNATASREWQRAASGRFVDQIQYVIDRYDEYFDDGAARTTSDVEWRRVTREVYGTATLGEEDRLATVAGDLREQFEDRYFADLAGSDIYALSLAEVELALPDADPRPTIEPLWDALPDMHDGNQALYFGRLTAIEGIATGDEGTVEEGIERILDRHMEKVRWQEVRHVAERCVSYPAAGLLAIARLRGLDVAVDTEYVPDTLYVHDDRS